MSKQDDAAYAWFLKGYNCSQSVVATFAPQLGLTEEIALRRPVRRVHRGAPGRGGTAFTGRMRKCGLSNWN